MLIDFKLPYASYPRFRASVLHSEVTAEYVCDAFLAYPNGVRCSGERTPLGEPIAIEVYSVRNDGLLARGVFVVSAIGLPTPVSVSITPPRATPSATRTPFQTSTRTPRPTRSEPATATP
jgi:hypothetical protein